MTSATRDFTTVPRAAPMTIFCLCYRFQAGFQFESLHLVRRSRVVCVLAVFICKNFLAGYSESGRQIFQFTIFKSETLCYIARVEKVRDRNRSSRAVRKALGDGRNYRVAEKRIRGPADVVRQHVFKQQTVVGCNGSLTPQPGPPVGHAEVVLQTPRPPLVVVGDICRCAPRQRIRSALCPITECDLTHM